MAEEPVRCTGRGAARPRHSPLPVLHENGPPPLRGSRISRWRAFSLLAVHALMILHFMHWLYAGQTVTPVEPSESMETLRQGAVNAGFIFFALAIVATLIFGRFFCGWGCHLVAYQDLTAWLLKKIHWRPRAFHSRFLMLVPLAAAIYMFVLPLVERLYAIKRDMPVPPFSLHLTRTGFWDTFPGPVVAILTIVFCGMLIIHFLGSKGFCTYACPYGAFFSLAERFAPGRIRVTDACEGCGHCTAVCTSNVNVAREVKQFGMVVDPGCMKCMDCVSVCPNDALYFGFGRLPLVAGASPATASAGSWLPSVGMLAAQVGVVLVLLVAFISPMGIFDSTVQPLNLLLLLGAVALAFLLVSRLFLIQRDVKFDLSLTEEILAVVLFSFFFLAYRGIYGGQIPFLFGLGVAAILTFIVITTARLSYRSDVSIQKTRFKTAGRILPSGWGLAVVTATIAVLTTHSGLWQWHEARASAAFDRTLPESFGWQFDRDFFNRATAEQEAAARRGIDHFTWCNRWGLIDSLSNETRLAWLELHVNQTDQAVDRIDRAARKRPDVVDLWLHLAKLREWQENMAGAEAALRHALDIEARTRQNLEHKAGPIPHPDSARVWLEWGIFLEHQGHTAQALDAVDSAVSFDPRAIAPRIALADLHIRSGRTDDARRVLIDAIKVNATDATVQLALSRCGRLESQNYSIAVEDYKSALKTRDDIAVLHGNLGYALMQLNQYDQALLSYARAVELHSTAVNLRAELGAVRLTAGDLPGALCEYETLVQMHPEDPEAALRLAFLYEQSNRPADAIRLYQRVKIDTNEQRRAAAVEALRRLGAG